MKIAIPSKARAGNVTTHKLFNTNDIFFFVEPQDFNKYQKCYPGCKIIDIGENNQGISYVRNFILDYFNEPILMLDDDIIRIDEKKPNGKMLKISNINNLLKDIELCFIKGYKQVTIAYRPAVRFNKGKSYKVNTRCWCFNGIDASIGVRFDPLADVFEDYDFTAELLRKGYKNISLFAYDFDCKVMSTNSGGWQCFDRKQYSQKAFNYLINKWGKHVIQKRINKISGLTEVQFLWNKIGGKK